MTEFARPTQVEIDRAIGLEEEYHAARPLGPDRVQQAVDLLYRDWQAEGAEFPDVLAFSAHVAATESPTAEGRGEVRALWSWRSQPEGAPREVGHRFLAQACGETRGYQVLEDTPVGRRLESYELWDPNVQMALIERFDLDEDLMEAAREIWDAASASYARAATGQVAVFAGEIGAESILGATEMPRVVGPGGAGKEAVGFPIAFPPQAHLPAEMYELMADPAVRCDLRREDYAAGGTTPEQFAARLAAIEVPERQREARAAAVARLSGAASYAELAGAVVRGAPGAQVPGAEGAQPALGQPGAEAAGAGRPTAERAEGRQPGVEQAGAQRPGAERAGAEQPEAGRPGVEQPAVERPEAGRRVVEQPETQQTGVEQAEALRPGGERSQAQQPGAEQPEAGRPGVEQPTVERPEAGRPVGEQPEAQQPEAAQPAVERSEAGQLKAGQPEAGQSEGKRAEDRMPTPANGFLPGVTIPRTIKVPAPRAASVSTHGVINPVIEAAPKSTGIEH
ncbi:hypothetical protein [Streptomyces sp. NPDC047014]|uniref:hypothetical protein n=1 Tax=Streptomyces sp. NPDC047014 TaxID=3155736 RepID=UPI00340F79EF